MKHLDASTLRSITERVERATAVLVGMPLSSAHLAADVLSLQFGELRETRSKLPNRTDTWLVGEYALHVQCPWRLTRHDEIVTGYFDRLYPPGDPLDEREGWEPNGPGSWGHERLREWTAKLPLSVVSLAADAFAGMRIVLAGDYVLEMFPIDSVQTEQWRLFRPGTDESHFVVLGAGQIDG